MADESRRALEELVLGRTVTPAYGGIRVDRYNRLLAHLFTEDGVWVQGRLLADGMARVYSFADNRALVDRMLAQEAPARAARSGIWSIPYYAILDTDAAASHIDRFALVEGRVMNAARVRGRVYLNFGADWKTDFTVSVSPADWKAFQAAGIAHEDYNGRLVRVRGWLKSRNGPMIDVTHPEQIEVITP